VVNAINLIDGLDGLAARVVLFSALVLLVLAVWGLPPWRDRLWDSSGTISTRRLFSWEMAAAIFWGICWRG